MTIESKFDVEQIATITFDNTIIRNTIKDKDSEWLKKLENIYRIATEKWETTLHEENYDSHDNTFKSRTIKSNQNRTVSIEMLVTKNSGITYTLHSTQTIKI